ncbi:hypothetical protein H9P43_008987 [Blastocladiella emersonii ATCC 22665]|nr:hypothetical protein H9P43_008987 [Blastocladiella emersonii ATCC 22665]
MTPEQLAAFMAIPRVRASLDRLRTSFPDLRVTLTAGGSLLLETADDDARPTTCPSCQLFFKRSNDAARHFQTAHASDTLPYVCVASCSTRTNRRDHFIDHLRRNPDSCALAFLCELAKSPAARDPDLMATAAALLPHQAAPDAPTAPGTALIPLLVRDIGFDAIDAALRKLEPDAVPAGLTHPLSLEAFGIVPATNDDAASDAVDPLVSPPASLRPPRRSSTRRRHRGQRQEKQQQQQQSRSRPRTRQASARAASRSPTPPPAPALAALDDGGAPPQPLAWDSRVLYPWGADESAADPAWPAEEDPFGAAPPPPLAHHAAAGAGDPLTVLDLVSFPPSVPAAPASPPPPSDMLQTMYVKETDVAQFLALAAGAGIAVSMGPVVPATEMATAMIAGLPSPAISPLVPSPSGTGATRWAPY